MALAAKGPCIGADGFLLIRERNVSKSWYKLVVWHVEGEYMEDKQSVSRAMEIIGLFPISS